MKRLFPVVCLFSCLVAAHSFAGSATWNLNPTTGDWNTAANWSPATVPMVAGDIATFDASSITSITISHFIEIDSMVFNPGAGAYSIGPLNGPSVVLSGAGIINNSGVTQRLLAMANTVSFVGSATIGGGVILTARENENGIFGEFAFANNASAGQATIICKGGTTNNSVGSTIEFFDDSTASQSTIILGGGAISGARGAVMVLYANASLGTATVIARAGVAGSGELYIPAFNDSTAATANLQLYGNRHLYIDAHNLPGFSLGSLEGNGGVYLGLNHNGRTLTVGNDRNTTFSGFIDDRGAHGSILKTGTGSLTLTYPNTYLGLTTVMQGQLLISNTTGSGTGTGPVNVDSGTLGGTGIIAGPVTIGTGAGSGAFLAPGARANIVGTLTLQSPLLFQNDASYQFEINTNRAAADQVKADGVTINTGAVFSQTAFGNMILTQGTVLTAINNTAATPISGTFANLADGGTITVGGNTLQANYEGGDGNDLTLTLVQ